MHKIQVIEFTNGWKPVLNGVAIGLPDSKYAAQCAAHDIARVIGQVDGGEEITVDTVEGNAP